MKKKNKKYSNYPCGLCASSCISDCICCDICNKWLHFSCEKLSATHLHILNGQKAQYICSSCCNTKTGSFDFNASLRRLNAAAKKSFKELQHACAVEEVYLRNQEVKEEVNYTNLPVQIDEQAMATLLPYDHSTEDLPKLPVVVSGDGNCLFNSISVSLYGSEKYATEIRARTCVEMVNHSRMYDDLFPYYLKLLSLDYVDDCLAAANNGSFSSARTIAAVSSALGTEIGSVYPPINGLIDRKFPCLNTTFAPFGADPTHLHPLINVLWTRCGDHAGSIWTPNHFVPLIKRQNLKFTVLHGEATDTWQHELVDLSDEQCHPNQSKNIISENVPFQQSVMGSQQSKSLEDLPHMIELQPSKGDASVIKSQDCFIKNSTNLSSLETEEIFEPDMTEFSTKTMKLEHSFVVEEQAASNSIPDRSHPCKFVNGQLDSDSRTNSNEDISKLASGTLENSFLERDKVISLLLQDADIPSSTVPLGVKENVYFLLNNQKHLNSRKGGNKAAFPDDCGAYSNKTSTKTAYFLYDSEKKTFSYIEKKNLFEATRDKSSFLNPQMRKY